MPFMSVLSDRTLFQLQAYSGLTTASFLSMHLVNHISTHFGWDEANSVLKLVRKYYQNPIIEPILIGAMLVHGAAGIIRVIRRRERQHLKEASNVEIADELGNVPILAPSNKYVGMQDMLHRYAGYTMLLLVPGHYLATRFIPLTKDIPIDLSYVTYSLEVFPIVFPIYYSIFASAGLYHMLLGIQKSLRYLGFHVKSFINSENFRLVAGIGLIIMTSSVLAYGGYYYDIPIPRRAQYLEILRDILPDFMLKNVHEHPLKEHVITGLKSIPDHIKSVPEHLRNVPEHLRNVPEHLRNIPEQMRTTPT